MRTRVSTNEVAHLWANQLQNNATNGSNFYYEGDTIYSYGRHFPIAVHSDTPNIVYFTTSGYSNATSKHIYLVNHACSHKTIIHCMNPDQAKNGHHSENIESFISQAKYPAGKLAKAKKPEIYLNEISNVRAEFQVYVNHFKITKKYLKQFNIEWLLITAKSELSGLTEKEQKRIKLAQKKQAQARKEQHERNIVQQQKEVQEFREFERNTISTREISIDYLRYNKESNVIETSQGVKIPAKVAKAFYFEVLNKIKNGGCSGDCDMKIEQFEVTSISHDYMKIGCHNIPVSEGTNIAKLLNW